MRRALIMLLTGAAACASPQYAYYPAEQATAALAGHRAARYEIPPEKPVGDVRVATFGIAELEYPGDVTVPALHVRLAVANNAGQTAWVLDTREVRAVFDHAGASGAAFSSGENPTLPVVRIAPGEERALDLYFQLPPGLEDAGELPKFDLLWKVHTDTRVVAERTPFERIRIVQQPTPTASYGFGLGPYWWYDPYYAPRTIIVERARPTIRFLPPRR